MQAPISARVICGLLLGWVWCSPVPVRADPSWADRLRTEALPAWDAEHANRIAVQGTCRITIRRTNVVTIVFQSKANTECGLTSRTDVESGEKELHAYNSKYTFRLHSTEEKGWALVSVHQGDPAANPVAKAIRDRIDQESRVMDLALRIPYSADLFTTVVRKPTMRVVSVTPVTLNGADVVEVKLEAAPGSKDDEIKSVTRLHDPVRNWRVVRAVVTGQRPSKTFELAADYEYAPGPDNLLTRMMEKSSYKDPDGKVTPVETERTFELKRLTTLPDTSEFTLTAFGLPEPIGVEWPKKRSPWLWFVAAGIGFVAVMGGLRWLSRRAARRTAAGAAPM